ncbi:MAG: response regulator [Phycisphaeraceae bacterium]
MPSIHSPITTNFKPVADSRPLHVLVVEDDRDVAAAISDAVARPATASHPRRVHQADCLEQARHVLSHQPINLVLIDLSLPDGNGLLFAEELRRDHPHIRAMIVTGQATFSAALAAIRAGAVDFIAKPLNVADLNHRIDAALNSQRRDQQAAQRVSRLRRLCRELNQARHQISRQVDVLCADLVTAYQDLASQVQHIELVSDLRSSLADELDLEQTLRRTLEFLVAKVGPANIAVFLPANDGGHSVGGYVNYSYERDQMPLVLDYLVDHLAPRLNDSDDIVHLTSDTQCAEFLGETSAWLEGQCLLAVACRDETGESLASIALFREDAEPFGDDILELLQAAGPLLAGHLVKVIRIHHRHHDLFNDESEDEGGLAA